MKKIINKLDIRVPIIFIMVFIILTLSYKLQLFIIYSGSMEPIIPKGSLVFSLKPEQNNDYSINKGDIITFVPFMNKPNSQITHRVYKIQDNKIFTKGDFNNVIDSWTINNSQIKGLYLLHIPLLGYVLHFLIKYPWYILIILGIIITFPESIKKNTISSYRNIIPFVLMPLIITFWSFPAYAQFNSFSITNNNSITTDKFYNYVSLKDNVNNNSTTFDIQNEPILDFGTVNKQTTFNNVLEIKNISSQTIKLNILDYSLYINSYFSTNKRQYIYLTPNEITYLSININKKITSNKSDLIKLQLNNSNYYKSNITINY